MSQSRAELALTCLILFPRAGWVCESSSNLCLQESLELRLAVKALAGGRLRPDETGRRRLQHQLNTTPSHESRVWLGNLKQAY